MDHHYKIYYVALRFPSSHFSAIYIYDFLARRKFYEFPILHEYKTETLEWEARCYTKKKLLCENKKTKQIFLIY